MKAAGQMGSAAARIAVGEVVSSTAADLARKSLRVMLLSQLKAGASVAVFLIALVGLAWGIGTYGQDKAPSRDAPRMERPHAAPAATPARAKADKPDDLHELVTYQGRVIDPEGRPFTGAALHLVSDSLRESGTPRIRARSGPDGRFRFAVPKSDFYTLTYADGDAPWASASVLAQASGYAFSMSKDRPDAGEMTLQLARDDVPITGRVIDLEGHPVAGATLTVIGLNAPAQGSLDGFLKAVNDGKDVRDSEDFFQDILPPSEAVPPFIPPVKTGADGRFRLSGIGRERIATLEIQGSTIETVQVGVRTRPGETLRVEVYDEERFTIYGTTFEHVAGPSCPIEGIVRDLDTRKPLAGIMVLGERELLLAEFRSVPRITDAQGHYRLEGLPRGREGHVVALAPVDFRHAAKRDATLKLPRDEDLPYVGARVEVGNPGGMGTLKLDINLKRGVWVTGRVIEADTGKPVYATVEYCAFVDNPHLDKLPWLFVRSASKLITRGGMEPFASSPYPVPGCSRPVRRRMFISRVRALIRSSTSRQTGSSKLIPASQFPGIIMSSPRSTRPRVRCR